MRRHVLLQSKAMSTLMIMPGMHTSWNAYLLGHEALQQAAVPAEQQA